MQNKEIVTITTSYILPLYENEKGYCIFLYKRMEDDKTITCKGNYLPKISHIKYEMEGVWEETQKHGMNFQVQSYREIIENTKEGIVSYLSSGVIKGIGKTIAERIYLRFGENSLSVIENTPEKLLTIKGISAHRLDLIKNSYREKKVSREVIEFLLPFGITAKQTVKIIEELRIKSVQDIKKNPYRLFGIHGVSIQCVDAIARALEIPEDSMNRIKAHAVHILMQAELNGSTGIEAKEFGYSLIRSLNSDFFHKDNICSYTIALIKEGVLKHTKVKEYNNAKTYIYRAYTYRIESEIAEKIYDLSRQEVPEHKDVRHDLQMQCQKDNLELDETQIMAIESIIKNPFLIITGGPGTGKTTIIKQAADYLKEHEKGRKILFMAPSGRAARRIKEATGYEGFTINSSYGIIPGATWDNEEEFSIEDATIFCDEVSMVGIFLMHAMMCRTKLSCRLILVGDENQLPSVEAGAVLRDLITSGMVPVVKLTTIHRQKKNSLIYQNSKKIENGQSDLQSGEDFHIIHSNNSIEAQEKMIASYIYYVGIYGIKNVSCIVPRKEGYASVKAMNTILQDKLNPKTEGAMEWKAHGMKFRVGDPVMHLKNDMEVANGDIGYVTKIYVDEEDGITMEVLYFGDTIIRYNMDNIEELTIAYAYTVHKAEGSENKVVLSYLSKECGIRMLKRNLPYTASTRAKELFELYLTNDDALKVAIANDDKANRKTSLQYHLTRVFGGWMCIQ